MTAQPPVPPIPSATVILVRDAEESLKTLLLRRNSRLAFHGGAWVFPGGRIDAVDYPLDHPDDESVAARQAAVREAKEEAGLVISPERLIELSHWTTPDHQPRRFATWFYIAAAPEEAVQVDGGEIHAHQWQVPALALEAQRRGEIELPPPTFVTLTKLMAYHTVEAALEAIAAEPQEIFTPRYLDVPGGACALYGEDAGYEAGDVEQHGPRHRLWMVDGGWRYEREL